MDFALLLPLELALLLCHLPPLRSIDRTTTADCAVGTALPTKARVASRRAASLELLLWLSEMPCRRLA
uniref:Secreted protein n=1 Tax=Arundo donax TaxID=35708 RepID=A0A0A9FC15_ARUDO